MITLSTFAQFGPFALALLLSLLLVPVFRKIAFRLGWTDAPNFRKVHSAPVPVIGGVAVVLSASLALLANTSLPGLLSQHGLMLGTSLLMLVVGVLDDRFGIPPLYRLLIQFACSFALTSTGLRIESLYGIFGIYELPIFFQYIFTMVLIAGVVNAFNLMDGLDGLAGGMALSGFGLMAFLAWKLGMGELLALYLAMAGALVGFLRYNLSPKKIFLGDGGSLFLGYLMVVSGLLMIREVRVHSQIPEPMALLLVIGLFLLPVFDSLRVYRGRIKSGKSPFQADKTHLHHLFLQMGLAHRKTSLIINLLHIGLLLSALLCWNLGSLTAWLILATASIALVAGVLSLNQHVMTWIQKIREMEKTAVD